MQFTLSDLVRLTGAKPRALQLWADAGVIRAEPSTSRAGSGTHRRFSRDEAIVACIVAPFAQRKTTIGGLLMIGASIRKFIEGPSRNLLENAIKGKGNHFALVYWSGKEESRVQGVKMVSESAVPEIGFFQAMRRVAPSGAIIDVVDLPACLQGLDDH